MPPLTLLLVCIIYFLTKQQYNATIIKVSIYASCALAIIFYSNWLLKNSLSGIVYPVKRSNKYELRMTDKYFIVK